jgi:DNA helicase-2/ATP-dependent DNA helicase PcrA
MSSLSVTATSDNSSNDPLVGLNPEQREAAAHIDGPLLILAGAGSGKTRVLTCRIANLVLRHQVRPENILAVTFTNKAAEEMRHRLTGMLGEKQTKQLWVSTFHSACLKILRTHAPKIGFGHDFVVYDDDDSAGLIKRIALSLDIDIEKFPPKHYQKAIDAAKNDFLTPQQIREKSKWDTSNIAGVYEKYQEELQRSNAMDFGDLLFYALHLLRKCPEIAALYQEHLHYVLVDEYQDTNLVQYLFIRAITERRKNILVVGDDDQSIYRFRGANIRNILEFEKDYSHARVIKLEQNYRSTKNILRAAYEVVRHNVERKEKKIWSDGPEGEKINTYVGYTELEEARYIAQQIAARVRKGSAYKDFALLYRTNAQSRALEEALSRAKIPYKIFGGLRFYDRKEIKDILAYVRLTLQETDNQAFLRVVNTPPRGVGPASVKEIQNVAIAQGLSLLQATRKMVSEGLRQKGILQFLKIIDEAQLRANKPDATMLDVTTYVIEASEYVAKLKAQDDPQTESRIENLEELKVTSSYHDIDNQEVTGRERIRSFLDKVTLASSADTPSGTDANDFVSLMTLHLCKGLEFPIVFLTGVEDGLVPHARSLESPKETEEERRLCYVGITRAMKELYITRADSRGLVSAGGSFGTGGTYRMASRFMRDVPRDCFDTGIDEFLSSSDRINLREDAASDEGLRSRWGEDSASSSGSGYRQRPTTPGFAGVMRGSDLARQTSQPLKKTAVVFDDRGLKKASLADLSTGLEVVSEKFGKGTIQQIDSQDGDDVELSVKFEKFTQPKKLIWKFATLYIRFN